MVDFEEVAASWLFAFAAGAALWPPRAVYWEGVAAVVGEGPTLAAATVLTVCLGAGFVAWRGTGLHPFVLGAASAYLSGMVAVELVLAPESPVHFVLYGGLACCLVAGAALWRVRAGRRETLAAVGD